MAVNGIAVPDQADHGGAVIWVTGLAEAGKTTVSRELVRQFGRRGRLPILLDGNEVRAALDMTSSFDRAGRVRAAMIYARLCRMLAMEGHLVVMATISLFHQVQNWNRRHQPRYLEVLLDVPLGELRRRDSKGIYSSSGDDEIVGVGQAAEFPVAPDLIIRNYGDTDPSSAAAEILRACKEKGVLAARQAEPMSITR